MRRARLDPVLDAQSRHTLKPALVVADDNESETPSVTSDHLIKRANGRSLFSELSAKLSGMLSTVEVVVQDDQSSDKTLDGPMIFIGCT